MQCYVSVRKALRLPRLVKRVVLHAAAVDGNEHGLAIRCLPEPHVVAQPALDPAPFVVVRTGAFLCVLSAAPESVYVEAAHVFADLIEVFYEFTVCHTISISL